MMSLRSPEKYESLLSRLDRLADGVEGNAVDTQELQRLIEHDDDACWTYICYAHLLAGLHRRGAAVLIGDETAEFDSDVLGEEMLPIIHDPADLPPDSSGIGLSWGSFLAQEGPFSYVAAMAIMAIMAVFAWWSDLPMQIRSGTSSVVASTMSGNACRVTGSVGCRWSSGTCPNSEGFVPYGTRLQLEAGFAEIEFPTGAKVLLQGPADFECLAPCIGQLYAGKLVGRAAGQSQHGFTIHTPKASVVDLGTEFGIAVEQNGVTDVHVFEGAVEATPNDSPNEPNSTTRLSAGKSIRFQDGQSSAGVESEVTATSVHFVRHLPARMKLPLFNTGTGLGIGNSDPHWQVIALEENGRSSEQSAVVCSPVGHWLSNDPNRSQWISVDANPSAARDGGCYIFKTQFDLSGYDPAAVRIVVRYLADDAVEAIRLNGVELQVPNQRHPGSCSDFSSFTIRKNLIEGENTLEVVVSNAFDRMSKPRYNAMGLLLQMEGYANEP